MSASPVKIETAEYEFLVSPLTTEAKTIPREPRSTSARLDLGAESHPGLVRVRNEDHYMVAKISRSLEVLLDNLPPGEAPRGLEEDGYLMVVADGMGGMNAGDVASMLAISTGLRLADKSVKWGLKINEKEAREILERLSMYFREIDRRLTRESESDRRLFGMGTTLTLAYSVGVHLFLIHVGDSRAYLYRGGVLTQLTRDHTVAQALVDAGRLDEKDARRHARRNALTNYLGGHQGKIKADVRWLRLENGDRLLLCSDGLSDMVDDAAVADRLGRGEPAKQAVRGLVEAALAHGGRDNVTVVLADYGFLDPEPPQPPKPVDPSSEATEELPTISGPTDFT